MSQSEILTKIIAFSKMRNWNAEPNFIYCQEVNIFHINRTKIRLYKTEYKRLGNFGSLDLAYTNMRYIPSIDKWLIEAIRSFIPEAKKYKFKIYSFDNKNFESILTYLPTNGNI